MEIWKDIIDYEGLYKISNYGRIKSLDKYRDYKKTKRFVKGKILKYGISNGYHLISLSKFNNAKSFRAHRLVAETFILNPNNNPDINHINGNKIDNRVCNLEWVTHSENILHSYNVLKRKSNKGATWDNHKFSYEDCIKMIEMYKQKLSFTKIAKIYNSNHNTISKIIRNEKYNN